ncbi:MAG: hypothetical protein M3277_12925 [Actinomycetota bacterium]|nr:hypothetical protein [Actinomycetota bacterium]
MKTRRFLPLLLATLVAASLTVPSAVAQGKAKKKSGPQVMGKDDPADWGSNAESTLQPAGDLLGQELVEARMGMADKETVEFIIQLNSLPPWGGIPESSRYGWDFTVDGEAYGMSGAFTEVVRGMCNPLITDPACPPNVGDPAQLLDAPFFIRNGACTVGTGGPADCNVVAIINSVFDPAAATITIPVPLEAIEAKPGSKIEPGASFYGGTIYAAPALLVGLAAAPVDTMIVTKTFLVP